MSSPVPAAHKQTGPRTPEGKARSKMNASKHGLRAAAATLPGEDPAECAQFLADTAADLQPVGAAEAALADQAATALWRLRRSGRWEAARARLAAAADRERLGPRLDEADREIAKLRADLGNLQKDPAADPPLAVRLPALADDRRVGPAEVDELHGAWADRLPDPRPAPGLGEACRRAGLPPEAAREPLGWRGWTAAHARLVVRELAAAQGVTPDQVLREAEAEWRATLPDERADRRRRRAELRREVRAVELRKQDLLADRAAPEGLRLDLLARYEAAALRTFDRTLKALLSLQDTRRRAGRRPPEPRDPV